MNITPWNYDVAQAYARRAAIREVTSSLIASMVLVAVFAFAVIVGEAVQESRATSHIIGASEFSVSKQQPERSGVLSAHMPLF
jgi:formate/nitrite transporter FocA (FNT family)